MNHQRSDASIQVLNNFPISGIVHKCKIFKQLYNFWHVSHIVMENYKWNSIYFRQCCMYWLSSLNIVYIFKMLFTLVPTGLRALSLPRISRFYIDLNVYVDLCLQFIHPFLIMWWVFFLKCSWMYSEIEQQNLHVF